MHNCGPKQHKWSKRVVCLSNRTKAVWACYWQDWSHSESKDIVGFSACPKRELQVVTLSLIDAFIWTRSTFHIGLRRQTIRGNSSQCFECSSTFLFIPLILPVRAVTSLCLVIRLPCRCQWNLISGHLGWWDEPEGTSMEMMTAANKLWTLSFAPRWFVQLKVNEL